MFLFFLVFLFSVSTYSQHERHYTNGHDFGQVISTKGDRRFCDGLSERNELWQLYG